MAVIEAEHEAEVLAQSLIRELSYSDPVHPGYVARARRDFQQQVAKVHHPIFERVLHGSGLGWAAQTESPDESIQAAGVPRHESRLPLFLGLVGGALLLGLAGFVVVHLIRSANRPVIATLSVPQVGATTSASVALKGGDEIYFTVAVKDLSWSGVNCVSIVVKATKGEAQVAGMNCCGYRVRGGTGSAHGVSQTREGCSLEIPAGGADGLWLSTRRANLDSALDGQGVEVLVRR